MKRLKILFVQQLPDRFFFWVDFDEIKEHEDGQFFSAESQSNFIDLWKKFKHKLKEDTGLFFHFNLYGGRYWVVENSRMEEKEIKASFEYEDITFRQLLHKLVCIRLMK